LRMFWTISKWASIGLLILFFLLLSVAALPDFQHRPEIGCYTGNALISYVECRGFLGSGVLYLLLNWSMWVFIYGWMFLWIEVFTGALFDHAAEAPLIILLEVVAVCWLALGLAYPIRWLVLHLRRRGHA
jgi:hypothetical protein